MSERLTDEDLDELDSWGTSPNPSTTRLVVKEIRSLRAERDEAIRQSQGYLKHGRELIDQNDALRARVAKLEAALRQARPFVNMAVTQEQAEASPRWHSKAVNALVGIDAALKEAP